MMISKTKLLLVLLSTVGTVSSFTVPSSCSSTSASTTSSSISARPLLSVHYHHNSLLLSPLSTTTTTTIKNNAHSLKKTKTLLTTSTSLRGILSTDEDAANNEEEATEAVSTSTGGGGGGGTATITSEVFNLVKNIVGAGVLSLPAGIAAFGMGYKSSAVIPALALITSIGTISAYGFSLIGRVCSMTGATSYRSAWDKTIGKQSSWIPAVSCTCKTIFAVLAYSMILADTSQQLLSTIGYTVGRTQSLLGLTGLILLPLCLMKNLSSLAPFSLLGSLGMCYTAIAMIIRYVGNGYVMPKGKFVSNIASKSLQPSFATTATTVGSSSGSIMSVISNPNIFILISMLSTAYMAHFNAPKFYIELKNNTIKRYNTVVASSFGISILLFSLIAAIGYLTFGTAASGVILSNYATTDKLMSASKIAVAISLIFSYPLAFVGVREGILDLFNIKDRSNQTKLNLLTITLLSMVTSAALIIKDVRFVLAFAGATLGNALIYIYPSLMFRKAIQNKGNDATAGQKKEIGIAMSTAGLGTIMGIIGSIMAIKAV